MPSRGSSARGQVITFYSFKGGVGRTMALANVACWLAKFGHRVLAVDWDLEAPGLRNYFEAYLPKSPRDQTGTIHLIAQNDSARKPELSSWRDTLEAVRFESSGELHIISAGNRAANYEDLLRNLNISEEFDRKNLGQRLETLRAEWIAEYDFVLVDSRTGVSDIGGICTIHLPDVVVAMFTSNNQSLGGTRQTMDRAAKMHSELEVDRTKLRVVPVLGRDESDNEFELSKTWLEKAGSELAHFFGAWLPTEETPIAAIEYTKIPYRPYWSYGEKWPHWTSVTLTGLTAWRPHFFRSLGFYPATSIGERQSLARKPPRPRL